MIPNKIVELTADGLYYMLLPEIKEMSQYKNMDGFLAYLKKAMPDIQKQWAFWTSPEGKGKQGAVPNRFINLKVFMITYLIDFVVNENPTDLPHLLQVIAYKESTMSPYVGGYYGAPPFGITKRSAVALNEGVINLILGMKAGRRLKTHYKKSLLWNGMAAYVTLVEKYKHLKKIKDWDKAHVRFRYLWRDSASTLLYFYNGSWLAAAYAKHAKKLLRI